MNVLILPSWYPYDSNDTGGSFFREQALALKEQGCTVAVLTQQLRPLRNWRSIFLGRYGVTYENDQEVSTFRKHGMKWFPWMENFQAWQCKKNLLGAFERYMQAYGQPDIIHVHSMLYAGWAAKSISQKYNIPYIITEHSSLYERGLITKNQKKLAKKISESASKRFAVSSSFAKFLSAYFKEKGVAWGVMPNMVTSPFFNASSDNSDESKPFSFVGIGSLTKNKGYDILMKAFAQVLKVQPDVRLIIGGVGSEQPELQSLAKKCGISDKVDLLGALSRKQVVQHILSSDVFVHSSFYETFGVVLIEALALGRPVISTRCGGPEDIVREQDGILVDVGDEGSLAEAMLHLYAHRKTYDRGELREACYERFSEKVVINKLMQVYRELLEEECKRG